MIGLKTGQESVLGNEHGGDSALKKFGKFSVPPALTGISAFILFARTSGADVAMRAHDTVSAFLLSGAGHLLPGYAGAWAAEKTLQFASRTKEFDQKVRYIGTYLGMTAANFALEVSQSLHEKMGISGDFLATPAMRQETLKDYAFAAGGLVIYHTIYGNQSQAMPSANIVPAASADV
jgi:hypothetical protein